MTRKRQDLTGQKFGKLTALKPDEPKPSKQQSMTTWLCQCDCGETIVVTSEYLKKGRTKSCGCLRRKNLIGQRFGKLTVKQRVENKITDEGRSLIMWECQCDCEQIITTTTDHLVTGNTEGCGCSRRKRDPKLSSAITIWKHEYTDGLSFDDFYRLSQLNCHYCNSPPNNNVNIFTHTSSENKRYSKFSKDNGNFIYNGLDRIDSELDHSKENVVPCCFICNRAKLERSYNEFIEYLQRLINHIIPELDSYKLVKELEHPTKTPIITSAKTVWGKNYKDGLSFKDFYHLSRLPCHYCGVLISNKYNYPVTRDYYSQYYKDNGYFEYNGLDRINSDLDHRFENVVPCCKYCNMAKSKMLLNKFIGWIETIKNHLPFLLKKNEKVG